MADKPYDLTAILDMCDNNRQFLEKLLLIFTDTLTTELGVIKQAASENNWAQVGKSAHKIKPSLNHFAVTAIKDEILGLEHYENTDPASLKLMVDRVELVINEVLTHLRDEFPELFNR